MRGTEVGGPAYAPWIAVALAITGCSDEGARPAKIDWGACPDYAPAGTQCAFVDVPLDWSQPNGRAIKVFAYRVLGSAPTKHGQIWFVQGGPGEAGATFLPFFAAAAQSHPDFDLYTIDQRGTGNSTNLRCPDEDFAACATSLRATWGDELQSFSTTSATSDLSYLIERAREPDLPVYVYGVSYGTFLSYRFLALHAHQASGAILDSIALPGVAFLDDADKDSNDTGRQVMSLCAADAECEKRLTTYAPDPQAAVDAVYAALDAGTLCPLPGLDRKALRFALAAPLPDGVGRVVVPAAVYRLLRCNTSDRQALARFFAATKGAQANAAATTSEVPDAGAPPFVPPDQLNSQVIQATIGLSELWHGTTLAEAVALDATLEFSEDIATGLATVQATSDWPVYHDPDLTRRPDTDIPMLLLNSTIDPSTPLPLALPARDIFNRSAQRFVAMPNAGHGVAFSTPMKDPDAEGCGTRLLFGFVEQPSAAPDTSCIADVYTLEWSGTSTQDRAAATRYFGVPDLWE